jgi:hypothetical protein
MKSEQEIQERIAQLEERRENHVSGSPEHQRVCGEIVALNWVLRDDE